MRIESIRLKNYKTFRDIHLRDVPAFLVVVGANGSGKWRIQVRSARRLMEV
jgi:predicted ATPase